MIQTQTIVFLSSSTCPVPLKHAGTQRWHSATVAQCLGCRLPHGTVENGFALRVMCECVTVKSRAVTTMNVWFWKVPQSFLVYSEFSHWISCKNHDFFFWLTPQEICASAIKIQSEKEEKTHFCQTCALFCCFGQWLVLLSGFGQLSDGIVMS